MVHLALLAALTFAQSHTITFDERTDADYYRVYVSLDHEFSGYGRRICQGSPCTFRLRKPRRGAVFFISVVGVNAAGEGPL